MSSLSRQPEWYFKRLVLLGMAAYTLWVGFLCTVKYRYYLYSDFDLAVHVQSVANILRGTGDCSLLGIPFLGNHMVLILYLLAPLQAVVASPITLLWIQTIVLAAGAWGIVLLSRNKLSPAWCAYLALAYLLHPALLSMNLFEFHPVALTTTFLIFAYVGYDQKRPALFWAMAIAAMACQENIALIVAAFSLLAWVDRRSWAWRVLPLFLGSAVFFITVHWLMPRLNHNTIQFTRLYSHLGDSPGDMIHNMLRHPLQVAAFMLGPEKTSFLCALLIPTAFIGLLCPRVMIPMLPVLAQRLLSARASETSIAFHYQAELLPFVIISAAFGLQRALQWRAKRPVIGPAIALVMLAAMMISSTVGGGLMHFVEPLRQRENDVRRHYDTLLAQIPPDSNIAASFRFLPHLALRNRVQSLHHLYTGTYTLSTKAYPIPSDLDYLVMDEQDTTFTDPGYRGANHANHLQYLLGDGTWIVVENLDGCLLLKRLTLETSATTPGRSVMSLTTPVPDAAGCNTNVVVSPCDIPVDLLGFTFTPRSESTHADLNLYWRKAATNIALSDFDVFLTLTTSEGTSKHVVSPGHRIRPPSTWVPSVIMRDTQGITLPQPLQPGEAVSLECLLLSRSPTQ